MLIVYSFKEPRQHFRGVGQEGSRVLGCVMVLSEKRESYLRLVIFTDSDIVHQMCA